MTKQSSSTVFGAKNKFKIIIIFFFLQNYETFPSSEMIKVPNLLM